MWWLALDGLLDHNTNAAPWVVIVVLNPSEDFMGGGLIELCEPSGVGWKGKVPNAALCNGVCVRENVSVDGSGVEFGGGDDERACQSDSLESRSPEVAVFTYKGFQGVGGE